MTHYRLWRTLDFIARVWNKRGAVGKSRRQKTEGRKQKAEGRRPQHLEGSVDSSWSRAANRLTTDG